MILALANLGTLVVTQGAVSGFWRGKKPIPGASEFNDTVRRTALISKNMRYM